MILKCHSISIVDYHIMKTKSPSLGRLLHFTNHRTVKEDLHIRICLILGISPYRFILTVSYCLVELNRSTLLGSENSFVKALKAYELILKKGGSILERIGPML